MAWGQTTERCLCPKKSVLSAQSPARYYPLYEGSIGNVQKQHSIIQPCRRSCPLEWSQALHITCVWLLGWWSETRGAYLRFGTFWFGSRQSATIPVPKGNIPLRCMSPSIPKDKRTDSSPYPCRLSSSPSSLSCGCEHGWVMPQVGEVEGITGTRA